MPTRLVPEWLKIQGTHHVLMYVASGAGKGLDRQVLQLQKTQSSALSMAEDVEM